MPSFEGVKQALSFDSILIAVAVVLLILGLIKAFVSGVEAWKKISLRDRVKKLEEDVTRINERLEVGNRRFKHQSEDMGQILQTLSALQVHFISGNDHDKLRQSNEELVAYMNERATRDAEEI
jgi:hypothetical protein